MNKAVLFYKTNSYQTADFIKIRSLARRGGQKVRPHINHHQPIESGDSNFTVHTLERYVDALGLNLNLISKDTDLFHYTAHIQSIYDGDTCRADIDLGVGIWVRNEKLRLMRINAPK